MGTHKSYAACMMVDHSPLESPSIRHSSFVLRNLELKFSQQYHEHNLENPSYSLEPLRSTRRKTTRRPSSWARSSSSTPSRNRVVRTCSPILSVFSWLANLITYLSLPSRNAWPLSENLLGFVAAGACRQFDAGLPTGLRQSLGTAMCGEDEASHRISW